MIYEARDGRKFGNVIQGRKYDRSLAERSREDFSRAPGGPAHEAAVRDHGIAREVHIVFEGPSRWRVRAVHDDGHEHTEVRPEAYLAHQIGGTLLGADNPPLGLSTQKNARNQAIGPKEEHEIRRADRRDEEAAHFDDFEEE